MDLIFRFGLFVVTAFYVVIFIFFTPKSKLLWSLAISFFTGLIVSFLSVFTYFGALASVRPFMSEIVSRNSAASIIKSALGGGLEEVIRSTLTLKVMSKTKENANLNSNLDDFVYPLGFIYGFFESYFIVLKLFSKDLGLMTSFFFGSINLSEANLNLPENTLLAILLFFGLILRYFVHITFLKISIFSLAQKKYIPFFLVILVHTAANFCVTFLASIQKIDDGLLIFTAASVIILVNYFLIKTFRLDLKVNALN